MRVGKAAPSAFLQVQVLLPPHASAAALAKVEAMHAGGRARTHTGHLPTAHPIHARAYTQRACARARTNTRALQSDSPLFACVGRSAQGAATGSNAHTNRAALGAQARGALSWPTWGCGVSKFPWTYQEGETCYVVEGLVVVTPSGKQTPAPRPNRHPHPHPHGRRVAAEHALKGHGPGCP